VRGVEPLSKFQAFESRKHPRHDISSYVYLYPLKQHSSESTADLHGTEQQFSRPRFKTGTSSSLVARVTSRVKLIHTSLSLSNFILHHKTNIYLHFVVRGKIHPDAFRFNVTTVCQSWTTLYVCLRSNWRGPIPSCKASMLSCSQTLVVCYDLIAYFDSPCL
jgi:hypothetical protein